MSYRAAIFDLDGTLLNTLDDLADSMNAVLARAGFPTHPADAYRYFVGDGVELLVRRALPQGKDEEDLVSRCMQGMEEEYGKRWDARTRPYPGIPEMLDALQERAFPKAVFSNKPDPFTRLTVAKLLAGWTFAHVQGARPEVPRKPDPAGALQVAERLGFAPRDILYLGDTNTDMKTARAAGMCAVGATWGFRTGSELEESGAHHLVDHPGEFLKLISRKVEI